MKAARMMCIAVLALAACSDADRALQRRISAEARGPAGTVVSMSGLTEFPWDRLHIFGPYTSQESIDRELGFSWKGASSTGISEDDGVILLVFVSANRVARHVVQPRADGDFADVKTTGGLSRGEAVFTLEVDTTGRRRWRVKGISEPAQGVDAERSHAESRRLPPVFHGTFEARGDPATGPPNLRDSGIALPEPEEPGEA